MLSDKEREIYQALANGQLSLAACLWSSWREKEFAYVQVKRADPFEPIFNSAKRVLDADEIKRQAALISDNGAIEKDFDKKKE